MEKFERKYFIGDKFIISGKEAEIVNLICNSQTIEITDFEILVNNKIYLYPYKTFDDLIKIKI